MGYLTSWTRWSRIIATATVVAMTTPLLAGCAAVASALPIVTAMVTDALAILVGIDTIVQEHFRRHPDVSLQARQRYAQLYDWTMRSLRALQKSADGAKDLEDGNVSAAFANFEAAFNELKDWLLQNQLMNDQSQLLLDGQLVSADPVPEARSLLR